MGSWIFSQKPSFEIHVILCKVLFHFLSKSYGKPKSGFRKIQNSTLSRPRNIFPSIRNVSYAHEDHGKCHISKSIFSRFWDHLTVKRVFEILTPKIDRQNRRNPPNGKNRKIDLSRSILLRWWQMGGQKSSGGNF